MIQRIQSVFLLLLALSMLAMTALPLWYKADPLAHQELTMSAWGFTAVGLPAPASPIWIIGVLALASAAVAAYEIFQFRNRSTQLKLGILNQLLIVATFGAMFLFIRTGEMALNMKLDGPVQPAGYLPLLALILNLLASRFIRSDERLVRSADRLR